MNSRANVTLAMVIAARAHSGQRDKAGEPYLKHVLRVAARCSDDRHAKVLGLLHDVCEESDWTPGMIAERFGERIGGEVDALTRRSGESYGDYIDRVIASGARACRVKVADLRDHLEHNPFAITDEHAERYRRALARLLIYAPDPR